MLLFCACAASAGGEEGRAWKTSANENLDAGNCFFFLLCGVSVQYLMLVLVLVLVLGLGLVSISTSTSIRINISIGHRHVPWWHKLYAQRLIQQRSTF